MKNLNKISLIALKVLIILSGTYTALAFNEKSGGFLVSVFDQNLDKVFAVICAMGVFVAVCLGLLMFKLNFLEELYEKFMKKPILARLGLSLISVLSAFAYIRYYNNYHINNAADYEGGFAFLPSQVMLLPMALFYLFFVCVLVELVASVLTSLARYERRFLLIGGTVGAAYIILVYTNTTAFYGTSGGWLDILYSYDSLVSYEYLLNPFYNWSFYQYPLQPQFTLPLMLIGEPFLQIWALCIRMIIQFWLLLTGFVMLSRMISDNARVRLISLLIFAFSFQTIILSLIVERRVMALVFVIFAIYHRLYRTNSENFDVSDPPRKIGENSYWLSIAAGGAICHAYVMILAIRTKEPKVLLKNLATCATVFLFLTTFTGKIAGLLNIRSQIDRFSEAGWIDVNLSMGDKLAHYMYLVGSSLLAPPAGAVEPVCYRASFVSQIWWQQMPELFGLFFWVGAVMFVLAIFGFICNFDKPFAQISLLCVAASVYFGFYNSLSADENAIILSTLFFGWGFVSLIIMGIDGLIKHTEAKNLVLEFVAAVCLVWNVNEAIQLYRFGAEHFPL